MTKKLYYEDVYASEFDAHIISQTEHDGKYELVLDETLFYPGGGGQPCDLGTLGGVEVLEVREHGDEIIHVLGDEIGGSEVHGVIDWPRRFEFMQQHLGEHLFAGCLHNTHQLHTARMRIEGDNISIDTDTPTAPEIILEAEALANEAVWRDIPVEVIYPPMDEIRAFARKLPPENSIPPIRIIKVEGVDYVPCCGLHVSSTGQAGLVKAVSFENHKGGTRIYLKCGRPAYRWLRDVDHELRKAEAELVCGYDGLNDKILSLKGQLHDLKAMNDATIDHYLKPLAHELIEKSDGKIIAHVLRGSGQDEIKHLFRLISEADHEAVVILAGLAGEGVFLMAGTNRENRGVDVRPAFRKAIELLEGKGGGSAFSAQGWGKNGERVNEAVSAAVATLKDNAK